MQGTNSVELILVTLTRYSRIDWFESILTSGGSQIVDVQGAWSSMMFVNACYECLANSCRGPCGCHYLTVNNLNLWDCTGMLATNSLTAVDCSTSVAMITALKDELNNKV